VFLLSVPCQNVSAARAVQADGNPVFDAEKSEVNPLFTGITGDILCAAFSYLNTDNPLIKRFNERNGDNIKAYSNYQYGLPYLWTGSGKLLQGDPLRVVYLYASVSNDYRHGVPYLPGVDCIGFVRVVYEKISGRKNGDIPSISQMLDRTQDHVNLSVDPSELYRFLKIGDVFACASKNGRHVLMYIGTLRDYGYSQRDLPYLAPYLTYPLVIHCGDNNFQRDEYARFIADNQLNEYNGFKKSRIGLPSGGVCLSIIGVPESAATKSEPLFNGTRIIYSLQLEGYELMIYDFFGKQKHAVYRAPIIETLGAGFTQTPNGGSR